MRALAVYVENGVGMAYDDGSAAWVYDVPCWGLCGQGPDEIEALRDLRRLLGPDVDIVVAERVEGDERAFTRDHAPCTQEERRLTMTILEEVRRETLALLRSCTDAELDWDDLVDELTLSARHVAEHLRAAPSDLVIESDGQTWTTVKLLRRLAWHERAELAVMRVMLRNARMSRNQYGT